MNNKIKLFFVFILLSVFSITSAMEEDGKAVKIDANQALASAISAGDVQGVTIALENGADVNATFTRQVMSLVGHVTAEEPVIFCTLDKPDGQALPIIKVLLQHKVDLNSRDYNNNTPLHIAARRKKPELVKFLIKYGASLGLQTSLHKFTPLHTAIASDDIKTVQAMITQWPMDNRPKFQSIFALLCCFKRFKKMKPKTIIIPKDIRFLLCRYCLKENKDIDVEVDNHLAILQQYLESKSGGYTPYGLAIARRNGLEDEESEYPTISDEEFYKEISNFEAIAALLDPKDDQHRRKVIQEFVYKELMSKIPGVNQMPK